MHLLASICFVAIAHAQPVILGEGASTECTDCCCFADYCYGCCCAGGTPGGPEMCTWATGGSESCQMCPDDHPKCHPSPAPTPSPPPPTPPVCTDCCCDADYCYGCCCAGGTPGGPEMCTWATGGSESCQMCPDDHPKCHPSPAPTPPPSPHCDLVPGFTVQGSIKNITGVSNPGICCDECTKTNGCVSFTVMGSMCKLSDSVRYGNEMQGATSGFVRKQKPTSW
jgi:hypothetical protein